MEVYRDIVGYEGLYQVSNNGNIRSLNYNRRKTTGLLKPIKDKHGYLKVMLYKHGIKRKLYFVHRLVAEAFIPNPNNLPFVNHKDENPSNNFENNLEWCDANYNLNYGTRNDRISYKMTNGKLSKPVLQYTKSGEFVREYPSAMEAKRNGYHQGHIISCCNGERKTHGGFIWKFKKAVV